LDALDETLPVGIESRFKRGNEQAANSSAPAAFSIEKATL
jgi:hypothetical protein